MSKQSELTYGNERKPLTLLVAHNSSGVRIQYRLAVHEEPVAMVAMAQFHLSLPPTVH